MRAAFAQRAAAVKKLAQDSPGRVVAFSPVGFPGRWSAIRSTVVLIDDVYALVGTSHLRRRGMTFDGGVVGREPGPATRRLGGVHRRLLRSGKPWSRASSGWTCPRGRLRRRPYGHAWLDRSLSSPRWSSCLPRVGRGTAHPSGPGRPTRRSSRRAMTSPIRTGSTRARTPARPLRVCHPRGLRRRAQRSAETNVPAVEQDFCILRRCSSPSAISSFELCFGSLPITTCVSARPRSSSFVTNWQC